MEGSSIDKKMMRIKDIILIVVSIVSLSGVIFKVYSKPYELESRISIVEECLADRKPLIDENTTKIAVMQSQFAVIIQRLDRIEAKIDKR